MESVITVSSGFEPLYEKVFVCKTNQYTHDLYAKVSLTKSVNIKCKLSETVRVCVRACVCV